MVNLGKSSLSDLRKLVPRPCCYIGSGLCNGEERKGDWRRKIISAESRCYLYVISIVSSLITKCFSGVLEKS